jgi:hypothetical protein
MVAKGRNVLMRINRVLDFCVLVLATSAFLSTPVTGQDKKNNSKPAPAAKPASSPARPTGGAAPSSNLSRGPSANGPSANHPAGLSPNHPSGPSANGPGPTHISGPGPGSKQPSANNPPGGPMNPQPQRQPPVIPERGGHQPSVPSHSVNLGGGHAAAAGINNKVAPHGSQQRSLRDGSAIQRRPDGRISDVRDARRGVDIHNGLNGRRSVSVERPDHSRIFAERGRPGYIRREYSFRGHDFARRAYYFHGRAYNRFYRPYGYRGVLVDVYAPGLYYGPGFYGWVYNPWYAPVAYTWGWGGAAWVGYYGFYFAPAQVYPSAAF